MSDCCEIEEEKEISCHCDNDETHHDHEHDSEFAWREFAPSLLSFVLLVTGLLIEYVFQLSFFDSWIKVIWYLFAYLPVALPVLKLSWQSLKKGNVFNEFFLMSIATLGAFAISEYPEGVAVMLFYTVGELFQGFAVKKANRSIRSLLDLRAKVATIIINEKAVTVPVADVELDTVIQVKVGERIPLDGRLISKRAVVDNAAITGESKPQIISKGTVLLAGGINTETVITLTTEKLFEDSYISRVLEMVQNATAKKSETELLIRKLAKIYTPIVVYLAIAIMVLPYFFVSDYLFADWLYRALIFLVISCPCALVISIPLGYFGGLGLASQNGILFKGATYLDQLSKVNTIVMDKTGTLTEGVFEIQEIVTENNISEQEIMRYLIALESYSNHPIAKAIMKYNNISQLPKATDVHEIAGQGLFGIVDNKRVLVGNIRLMEAQKIEVPDVVNNVVVSMVLVSVEDKFIGYITIADKIKTDAIATIQAFKKMGMHKLVMLSGDRHGLTLEVAKKLGITIAKGDLMPADKLREVTILKEDTKNIVAFVGDGINDAPVLAISDIGIAMGGGGSDVAIETADVIIQTDEPSKIIQGIKIGKLTQKIIWQNIIFALIIKGIVLVLGALGYANMWAAVFADVGVALLAILNAVRLQRMQV